MRPMGRSWKQCAHAQPSTLKEVQYQWSTQSYTVREILKNFKLPTVIQCAADVGAVLMSSFQFDLRQPLLLYSRRSVKKACGRCVKWEGCPGEAWQGRYVDSGPPVVIPEDYEGWFYVSQSESDKPSVHGTIEEVARSNKSEFFMTDSTFYALLETSDPNGEITYQERDVVQGDVFKKVVIGEFMSTSGFGENLISEEGTRYLKCLDEKEDKVVFPFTQKGEFYDVKYENAANDKVLTTISEIIRTQFFPVLAQHVHGNPPSVSEGYTRVLVFDEVIDEETVMASTLGHEEIIPLEMQTVSPVKFKIALNEAKIRLTDDYLDAIDMCETEGEKYVRDIKVAFKLSPANEKINSVDDINMGLFARTRSSIASNVSSFYSDDFSAYETGSELGEVDANSEFSIDWEPERTMNVRDVVSGYSNETMYSSNTMVETPVWNDTVDFV